MSHFEGPIVDSFYEVALQSWYNRLSPPLPFIATPYDPPRDSAGNIRYLFADRNPYFDDIEVVKAAKAARLLLKEQTKDTDLEKENQAQLERQTFSDAVRRKIEQQRASLANWAPGEQLDMRAQQAMRDLREFKEKWSWNPSRAGSRAPSRRASMGEIVRGKLHLCARSSNRLMKFTVADANRELQDDGRVPEQSEAPSSPTIVGSELPKSKTYPDPGQPHVAFVGVGNHENEKSDSPPNTSELEAGQHNADPAKRAAPPTVLFTEAGGVREGPPAPITDVPTIVASPTTSHNDLPVSAPTTSTMKNDVGEDLPASARMPHEQAGKEMTGDDMRKQTLPLPKSVTAVQEGEKPRLSGESEVRPEGTGTKRMFQLSKRFSKSIIPPSPRPGNIADVM